MLTENPFLSRSTYSTTSPTITYDRHYFPTLPRNNIGKPGFLLNSHSQDSLPTLHGGDARSPYFQMGHRTYNRNKGYVQNPFYKSHLLQDSIGYGGRLYQSDVGLGGGVIESRVRTLYQHEDEYVAKNYNNVGVEYMDGSVKSNSGSYVKKKSSEKNVNYNRGSMGVQGMGKKASTGSNGSLGGYDNPQNSDSETERLLRKQSSGNNRFNSGQRISERPNQQEQDDPMNYNYPSFNMKGQMQAGQRQQSLQSPTFPGLYRPFNQEKQTSTGGWPRNQSYGIQASNLRKQNIPQQIVYNGRQFYQVNIDEL